MWSTCSCVGQVRLRGGDAADRADRARLGHPPSVQHVDPAGAEALDHPAPGRRPAGRGHPQRRHRGAGLVPVRQKPQVDRGDAAVEGHTLGVHELGEAGAVQARSGQDQLVAAHRRAVWDPPRVDVEHRHHRQHRFARADAERAGHRRAVRVEDGRPVGVDHALRVARGPRRVADARGRVLVERRPCEVTVLFGRGAPRSRARRRPSCPACAPGRSSPRGGARSRAGPRPPPPAERTSDRPRGLGPPRG